MGFFFAWVADGTTAFGEAHHVEDEEVFAFLLEHKEGDFASLQLTIRNPRVGLLNDDRDRWAWVSYQKADLTVVPMFHGRLIGFPKDMTKTLVTLEFLARPVDFVAQKKALADSLKVDPYYDPVFVDKDHRDDADVVWQGRSELWHIGRTDKLVTSSNIINGEDGTIELTGADIEENSLGVQYGLPISKVHVEATVSWNQRGQGIVDVTKPLVKAFEAAGAPPLNCASYTGEGFENTFPHHNDNVGGGWSVYQAQPGLTNTSIKSSSYLKVKINPALAIPDFTIEDWWADSFQGYDYWYKKSYDAWLAAKIAETPVEARFYLWLFQPTFVLAYDGSRQCEEVLSFDLVSDMQELVTTDDEPPKPEEIKISSQSVSELITDEVGNSELPIGKLSNKSYFSLDRGKRSINYLIALARAKMLFAARCVTVSFNVSFEQALAFSCRKNIQLAVDELPGGVALGKIIGYSMTLAAGGKISGSVSIACTVGRGNAEAAPTAGDPVYAAPGYMVDYQSYVGGELQPIIGEVTYKEFKPVKTKDDGLDLDNMTADNVIGDTAATALLTLSGPGADGNTITIGPRTYTLKAALTAANQIKIGATKEATADNIAAAIIRDELLEGIAFGTGTIANTQVSAVAQDGIVRVTAIVPGTVGNAIAVARVGAALTWDHATLTTGGFGLVVINGPAAQAAALAGEFSSPEAAADALNAKFTEVELTMKPIDGGPFSTPIALVVSKLMVPKTIDLEADAL